jgi:hypothetical protein
MEAHPPLHAVVEVHLGGMEAHPEAVTLNLTQEFWRLTPELLMFTLESWILTLKSLKLTLVSCNYTLELWMLTLELWMLTLASRELIHRRLITQKTKCFVWINTGKRVCEKPPQVEPL